MVDRQSVPVALDERAVRSRRQHALRCCLMVWRDQDPPATDVLLDVNLPFSGGGSPAYLELDKLPDGWKELSSRTARRVLRKQPRAAAWFT